MHLSVEAPGETLWAVVCGAVLATAGGFVATQFEAGLRRRERERSAALLFGENLTALQTLVRIAAANRSVGVPYGPVTQRSLRAARRETENYERNRSLLYDLRDPETRIRVHVLMVGATIAVEGVLESTSALERLEASGSAAGHAETEARVETLRRDRESAFAFALETIGMVDPIIDKLKPIARMNFEALKKFSDDPALSRAARP